MKLLANQKGIALVTALMLTLISLTIVMYLMYMITAGVKMSGANKRYKTAQEAAYGSTDIVLRDVIPILFNNMTGAGWSPRTNLGASGFASFLNIESSTDDCLKEKLTRPASKWSSTCSSLPDAKTAYDIKLNLNSNADPFSVYTKIVETMCSDPKPYPVGKCTGSDLSGVHLDCAAGTTGGCGGVSVQHLPATYRIEVQGERSTNPLEKSKLSILYAY
jgi:hypothetical protein